jgi:tetratricopeptide (TPR) repeat protein
MIWKLLFATTLILASTAGPAQTLSSEMNAGVEAYKSAQYELAIAHFQQAIQLDSSLAVAHLYLATAYAQQYIPGAESPDNTRFGDSALKEFSRVLELNSTPPQRLRALQGRASLLFNMKHFDQAKEQYADIISLDPGNPEPYYSIAVIDWTESYTPRMDLRKTMGLKPTDELQAGSACNLLRSMNEKKVEDGIQNLTRAIELRPDYDDAMAYMNLLYREKAEYECDTPEQRTADLRLADQWVDRTIAVKKAKAEATEASAKPQ